jgi:hypothetical protein
MEPSMRASTTPLDDINGTCSTSFNPSDADILTDISAEFENGMPM